MTSTRTWIAMAMLGALGCSADVDSSASDDALSTTTSTPTGTLLTTNDDLNLRASASTSAAVYEVMPKGTRVIALSSNVSGFRKVKVVDSGDVGYAYGTYLDVTGTVPSLSSAVASSTWSCGDSSYQSKQYWTCADGTHVYSCKGDGTPKRVTCSNGCIRLPAGYDDVCSTTATTTTPVTLPAINVSVHSGSFSQSQMVSSVKAGLTYEIARVNKLVPQSVGRTLPSVTLEFWDSSDSFCSGLTTTNHIDVYCPYGYPYSGDNQNYVENITMHELGHYLARYLIADPGAHDNCVNEGAGSWIAGKYWMNDGSTYVGSLKAAADAAINTGNPVLSITSSCSIVGDRQYKVWASYLEYLQTHVSNGVYNVMTGATSAGTYEQAWLNWL